MNATTLAKSIQSITVRRVSDTDPDLSHLGEYGNAFTQEDFNAGKVIDRQERGDCGRNEFRYFIAAMSGEDTGNPESVEQDYKRMEQFGNGWYMEGIYARADIVVGNTCQRIRSGGLYGIESDSDSDYFDSVANEQLAELREQLSALGFDDAAIDAAIPTKIEFKYE